MRSPSATQPRLRFHEVAVVRGSFWKMARGICLVTLSACAGTLDNPAAFTTGLEGGSGGACGDVPATLLAPTCGVPGCHSPPTNQSALGLASVGVGSRLVDHQAIGGPGSLIDSQNPDQSVILAKVRPNPLFGAAMPLGKPPLTPEQLQCLQAWVVAQARAGGVDAGNGGTLPTADAGAE
ncbi:MAG: hypothetical protein M3O36_21055 [Myxococcota bacterium]|nr:hypothetical protein [Myxococcota bacterium]